MSIRVHWCLALALLAGCRDRRCQRAFDRGDFKEAVLACSTEYAAHPSPHGAILLAGAQLNVGHDDQALELAERYRDSTERANALQIAGMIYDRRGKSERAQESLRAALELHQRAGDHRQAARDCHALAGSFYREGRYRDALVTFNTFDREATDSGEPRLRAHALLGLADILTEIGDHSSAEQMLDNAEHILGDRYPADRAYVKLSQGILRSEQGLYSLANQSLTQALADAAAAGRNSLTEWSLLWLCQNDRQDGRLEEAAAHCASAAKLVKPDSQASWRTGVFYQQAMLARALHHPDEARRVLAEAENAGAVPEWEWRIALLHAGLAEDAGDAAAAERNYEAAIDVIERLRRALKFDELKPWLLEQKREPYELLLDLQARQGRAEDAFYTTARLEARTLLDDVIAGEGSRVGEPASAGDQAWLRGSTLQRFLPRLHDSPGNLPRRYRDVAAALAHADVLIYGFGRAHSWLFSIHEGRLTLRALSATPEQIARAVENLNAQPDDLANAQSLGSLLLPDWALPRAGRVLHIVPSGALRAVSFAALRRGHRFLVEDYDVSYAPNAAMLAAPFAEPSASDPALVLADPRGDLPAASEEAVRVAAALHVRARTGGEATIERLKSEKQPSVLHLATHVELRPQGAVLSLADGDVGAAELLDWSVHGTLVVLAACGSSASRDREGAGALSAIFLANGSRAVLGTLHSIDDTRTADLMDRFYAAEGARAPVHALATVQRELAKGSPPSHWAPFLIHGVEAAP